MTQTDQYYTPPDDASDLWGYPPKDHVICDRCGEPDVEPYRGSTCWLCLAVRQAFAAYHPAGRG